MTSQLHKKLQSTDEPRICVVSLRNIKKLVSRCPEYEFEDFILATSNAQMIAPQPRMYFTTGQKVANRLNRHLGVRRFNPGIQRTALQKDYDLLIIKCLEPSDLYVLNAITSWRKRSRVTVCWLSEIWAHEINRWAGTWKILSQFDHVVLSFKGSLEPVGKAAGKRCDYVPLGVDALRFCPYPNPPTRVIDICNLGRRSEVTHKAFLELAAKKEIFYLYDTIARLDARSCCEHRNLLASLEMRSRYIVVNRAKIDLNSETGGQREIGARFYEGAASGAVMIGVPPDGETFEQQFGWPDSVIRVPYDSPDIANILADLDSQPERMERASKNNVAQTLLRHDWVYRWRSILDLTGLPAGPALAQREKQLKQLAGKLQDPSAALKER